MGIVIAVALAWGVGFLQGGENGKRHTAPHQHAQAAEGRTLASCADREGAGLAECVQEKVEASEETARAEQDLTAQQQAAWGSMFGALWGGVGLCITVVGTILLYQQFVLTRQAVEDTGGALNEARRANRLNLLSEKRTRRQQREAADDSAKVLEQSVRAADAANEQVKLSRLALERVERAFMVMNGLKITTISNPHNREVLGWEIKAIWRNTGKTPAHRTMTHSNATFVNGEIEPNFAFPDFGNISYSARIAGPDTESFSSAVFIPVDVAKEMSDKTLFGYFWGWFEYDDVFNEEKRRRTEFYLKIDVSGEPFPTGTNISHTMLEGHNGADDYCSQLPRTTGREQPTSAVPGHNPNPLSRFVSAHIRAARLVKCDGGWRAHFFISVLNLNQQKIFLIRLPRGQSIGGLPDRPIDYPNVPPSGATQIEAMQDWEMSIGGEEDGIIDELAGTQILEGKWPFYVFGRVEFVSIDGIEGSVGFCFLINFSSPEVGVPKAVISPAYWQST